MPKIRPLKSGEMIRALEKLGFQHIRQAAATPFIAIPMEAGQPSQSTKEKKSPKDSYTKS